MRWSAVRLCLLAALTSLPAVTTRADGVADFYHGKEIRFYIRAAPGGNYDIYSRLLGQYMTRYLPGRPGVLPINMPGGGGLVALNYVANVAPKDGTALTMITESFALDQALDLNKNLKVDLRTLNWIGDMSNSNQFLFTSKSSPTKTLDDARRRVTLMAATGNGSIMTLLISLYNSLLGTKFKVIYGYPSGPDMSLAMERGEVEGRSTSNPAALAATPAEARSKYNFLIQAGLRKATGYEDVPLLLDLAKSDEDRRIFNFFSEGVGIARPVITNSGVPPERVAALRRAFTAAMRDPNLIADARRLALPISSMDGNELQKLVFDLLGAPSSLRAEVASAMAVKSPQKVDSDVTRRPRAETSKSPPGAPDAARQ